jgi:hypothetical protein
MIRVRLAGGLGNQLFQLAAALHLRARGARVLLHTSSLGRYAVARSPDLLRMIDCQGLDVGVHAGGGLANQAVVQGRVGRWLPWLGVNDAAFPSLHPASRAAAIMDGYFQDSWTEASILAIRAELTQQLVLPVVPDAQRLPFAMHVRGGDMLKDPDLAIIDSQWYSAQLSAMNQDESINHVSVITDDVPFATRLTEEICQNLPQLSFRIMHGTDALDDFNALRCARRRLTGNSTFAVWATALDPWGAPTRASARLGLGRRRTWRVPWEELC